MSNQCGTRHDMVKNQLPFLEAGSAQSSQPAKFTSVCKRLKNLKCTPCVVHAYFGPRHRNVAKILGLG
jgi:hypothetical protein